MHLKGHIREAFGDAVESGFFREENLALDTPVDMEVGYVPTKVPLRRLLGLLWNCTDIMPSSLRGDLLSWFDWEDEAYTYAQAVQRIHQDLRSIRILVCVLSNYRPDSLSWAPALRLPQSPADTIVA